MKNKLGDLNNHLFEQLERLNDDECKGAKLKEETERARAMVGVSDQIVKNAAVQLTAVRMAVSAGAKIDPTIHLPMIATKAEAITK